MRITKERLIKILLSASSFSGILLFFVLKNNPDIPYFSTLQIFVEMPLIIKNIFYIIIVIIFAWFVLFLTKKILPSNWNLKIKSIKPVESAFLPAYIGLFVVALELNGIFSIETNTILIILFIFWIFLENISYFNPFFLFF